MEKRIGVISIIIEQRKISAPAVNNILGQYSDIIIGRMGIPYREKELSVIALIVEATTDQIGAMTGKLGNLQNVKVKSHMI